MGPPTCFFFFFFYISMHSYQNTDKINPEKIQTILESSGGADRSSGGLSGIMCKQLF